MKAVVILILVLFGMNGANAQERAVQLQQMIKLKLQNSLGREKSNIDQQGLRNISTHKNVTLQLFNNYFSSLSTVNNNVKNGDKVQDIRTMHQAIRRTFEVTIRNVAKSGVYQQEEIKELNSTYAKVQSDCREILRNLDLLLINGQYKMTDGQRVQRIDQLYDRMVGAFRFAKMFCSDVEVLRLSRLREKNDIEHIRGLYNPNFNNR